MCSFNPQSLVQKLQTLNETQASIETLSEWCRFYRQQAPAVVHAWDQEYAKSPPPKRLLMLYLANDILQNSRKKGPEFVTEFYRVLPRSLKHSLRHFDEPTRQKVNRLVKVWDERKVFGHTGVRALKDLLGDAEAPRKGLSARTGGPSAADSDPGTPREAPMPQILRPVAEAVAAASAAAARCSGLVDRCTKVLHKRLLEQGSIEEVSAATNLLQEYSGALDGEAAALDSSIAALQSLISQQTQARQRVQDQQALAARQLQAFTGRLAQMTGLPQPPVVSAAISARPSSGVASSAPAASAASTPFSGGYPAPYVPPQQPQPQFSPQQQAGLPHAAHHSMPMVSPAALAAAATPSPASAGNHSSPYPAPYSAPFSAAPPISQQQLSPAPIGSPYGAAAESMGHTLQQQQQQAVSGPVPPLPASVAQPLPAMSGPGGQPPMPISSAGEPPQPNGSPAAPLPNSEQPPLPDQDPVDLDMDVGEPPAPDQQPQTSSPQPPVPGETPNGSERPAAEDAATAAAAALVAQLSAAQDSQALLEALAALPQDQQREISLSFLSGGSSAAAMNADDQEEYDPEEPGF